MEFDYKIEEFIQLIDYWSSSSSNYSPWMTYFGIFSNAFDVFMPSRVSSCTDLISRIRGGEGEAGHLIFEEKLAKWEGWVTRSCVLVKGPRPQTLNVRVASWSRGLLQLTDDHWKIMTNVELPTTRQNVQLLSELNY